MGREKPESKTINFSASQFRKTRLHEKPQNFQQGVYQLLDLFEEQIWIRMRY